MRESLDGATGMDHVLRVWKAQEEKQRRRVMFPTKNTPAGMVLRLEIRLADWLSRSPDGSFSHRGIDWKWHPQVASPKAPIISAVLTFGHFEIFDVVHAASK